MAFWRDPSYADFWLGVARGDLATWIQLTPYAYAAIEGVHLIGVAFFFGSIFLLDLRLLGFAERLVAESTARFLLSVAAPAFALLLLSGVLLFVPSADRHAASPVFFLKLGAIAAGGLNALAFHVGSWQRVRTWSYAALPPSSARTAAMLSVAIWLGVIALGRAMGYERREAPSFDPAALPAFDARPAAGGG